jgi:type I restriction enzyme M protein
VQLIDAANIYSKMRKSLGNKTNELKEEQIQTIQNYFYNFTENGIAKRFDNDDFGYWKITVERPLRLSFQITDEKIATLENATEYNTLIKELQKTFGKTVNNNFNLLNPALDKALKEVEIKLKPKDRKSFIEAISWKDESAEKVIKKNDKEGIEYEPDTELRDYENIPLKQDIQAYFEREVLPYNDDAWIDESKTIKGYEISFTKIFYQYQPLRSVEEVAADILRLEVETDGLLKEIVT